MISKGTNSTSAFGSFSFALGLWMTSIMDRLPDELLSRIFTVGADDGTAVSDVGHQQQKLKHGQHYPKAFTRTVTPVCRRWHHLTKDRVNAHLWMVIASVKIGRGARNASDSCIALARFKDLIENTENGRRDIYVQLLALSSISLRSSIADLNDVRLLMFAIDLLVPHQRRLAGLSIGLWMGHCLDFLMEAIIHRFSNCPRLHVIRLQTVSLAPLSPLDGFLDFKLLHLRSNSVAGELLSPANFQYQASGASQVFRQLKGMILSPFLRCLRIPSEISGMAWADLLDIFDKCPNLELFMGGLPMSSNLPIILDSEMPISLRLKKLELSSNEAVAFAFLRRMSMPLLEELLIVTIRSPTSHQFDFTGTPLFLPSLKTLTYFCGARKRGVALIAHLARFPRLQWVKLDSPLPTPPVMDLIVPEPPSSIATEALVVTGFLPRIHLIPDQFNQIDLQNVVNLEIDISKDDLFFTQGKDKPIPHIQLHKLRTLKIRAMPMEMMLLRFLWTVVEFRSPCLETAICCDYGTNVLELVRLSFASSSIGDNQDSQHSRITSMALRAEFPVRFLKNIRGDPLYLDLLSDLKKLTIKLSSEARSEADKQEASKFLGSFLGIGLSRIPRIIPLPALEDFRVVVTGEREVALRLFPVVRQILDDLEKVRNKMALQVTRFVLDVEAGLGKPFQKPDV
jgi:hypothetical protein